jgi:lipid-A-disaccharide synthase
MTQVTKIFILAGEHSGDILGANLMKAIKFLDSGCLFYGVGGNKMQEVGFEEIFPMQDINLMGFIEVIPAIPRVLKRLNQAFQYIKNTKPDIVITIDSPDFSFRLAKKIKNANISTKLIHYVAPSVWAYRPNRAKLVAKLYDKLIALLPFEPPYFTKENLDTKFIGHPIFENMPDINEDMVQDFKDRFDLHDNKVIVVNIGSRLGEINSLWPIFKIVISNLKLKYPNLAVILPTTKSREKLIYKLTKELNTKFIIINDDLNKYLSFKAASLVISKSGTITLEAAICNAPMIVAHKVNPITAFLLKCLIKIKHVTLVNILAGKEVIPEILQSDCNPDVITRMAMNFLTKPKYAQEQIANTKNYIDQLRPPEDSTSSLIAAKFILEK